MARATSPRRSLLTRVSLGLSLLLASACTSPPGTSYEPSIRGSFAVIEGFEAEVSDGVGSVSGDSDYSSLELAIGAVQVEEDGRKIGRAELIFGSAEFGNLDAFELSGGGRFFVGGGEDLSPFLSIYTVSTILESIRFDPGGGVISLNPGVQLGLRLGGGVEYQLNETVFVDLGADYTLPLIAAEADVNGFGTPIETEVYGFAIRMSIGITF